MDHAGAIAHILKRLESELPEHLHYHGKHHTVDVLEAVKRIGSSEGISEEEQSLLLVAAAYHDCGFLNGHQEHELKGCEIARENLPDFGFDAPSIEQICNMIMSTRIPQTPQNLLSKILCDADLDYLGTDSFASIGTNLFEELSFLGIVTEIEVWNRIQIEFLSKHTYHTAYGKTHRQPIKQKHLEDLKVTVAGYDR